MEEELNSLADRLHQKRFEAAVVLEKKLIAVIRELKLPDTALTFSLEKTDELLETGKTKSILMFSANKGFVPVPIEKAASGGELSRVMLAMQKLLAEVKGLPALLLDEIDTGVSGDVARKIGVLLSEMGRNTQLIAISHLPQVAALAQHHFRVVKNADDESTKVAVMPLDSDERILELARLISGETITNNAIEAAKELMA
jgi:DNA repair protein RecN (Recombination protein N)